VPYKKTNRLLDLPQVRVQRLTAAAANARVYSAVFERKAFIAAIVSLKLPHGVPATDDNVPTRFEIYGVEDAADAANTRVLVVEKDLTGVTDASNWSGTLQIEVDETHFAAMLGSAADGSPHSLDHMQVAISAEEDEVFEVVVQFCDPYTQSRDLLDEANV
jgi:hypothetical protein